MIRILYLLPLLFISCSSIEKKHELLFELVKKHNGKTCDIIFVIENNTEKEQSFHEPKETLVCANFEIEYSYTETGHFESIIEKTAGSAIAQPTFTLMPGERKEFIIFDDLDLASVRKYISKENQKEYYIRARYTVKLDTIIYTNIIKLL